ncbi:flagellar basal body-associated FliL family protein [Pararhodobacter sp.]|uniref:flagellar basal body-associated FliL family protein n=1 Tax=Pararhodobacter sp. TaxID=2127056 RepID=UPI002AFF96B3|nr:flagellar basal body-associated FliL family protein [Pararhodobacter sp.]
MKKLMPILLLLIGLGAGGGAGWFLQPRAEAAAAPADQAGQPAAHGDAGADENAGHATASTTGHYAPPSGDTETVRMPNQFVVPLITEGEVRAMVVIGLALELRVGHGFSLPDKEPRLRAIFLQLLFDHANLGGFDGVFTSGEALLGLRRTLREAARSEIGTDLNDVLITELVRQET